MAVRLRRGVGFAEAFLRGGIANYVGTYWPVNDAAAEKFADVFYKKLLDGKSLGEAILSGRKELRTRTRPTGQTTSYMGITTSS